MKKRRMDIQKGENPLGDTVDNFPMGVCTMDTIEKQLALELAAVII